MKIYTWRSDDAPEKVRVVARIWAGKTFLPVVIQGASEELAIKKAEAFFKSEKVRISKQQAHTKKPPPPARAPIPVAAEPSIEDLLG